MSVAYSAESVDSISDLSEPGCASSGKSSATPMPEPCSPGDSPPPSSTTTCARLEQGTLPLSISSVGASLAKTLATPESEWASRVIARDSGGSSPESFANYDRLTSSWRTYQRSLAGGWGEWSETWPRAGMTRNGTAFRLEPLVLLT